MEIYTSILTPQGKILCPFILWYENKLFLRVQNVNDSSLASQIFLSCKNMKECDFCSCYIRDQNIIYRLCISVGQISIKLLHQSDTHPILIPCPGLTLTLIDFTWPDCHRAALSPSSNSNCNYCMAAAGCYRFHH